MTIIKFTYPVTHAKAYPPSKHWTIQGAVPVAHLYLIEKSARSGEPILRRKMLTLLPNTTNLRVTFYCLLNNLKTG